MRKIIFLMHVSLDGLVAGPNGEMDWITYDDEVQAAGHVLHQTTDAAIYGRVTYQMMESYFPTLLDNPAADKGDLAHAKWLDRSTKMVFSKTLKSVAWKNTVIIHDNIAEEMKRIKAQAGQDMWMLGSPTLAREFMRSDLIDEYRLNVNPVVLGKGMPLFAGLDKPINLKLLEAKTYKCGVVGMRYEPIRTST